MWLEYVLMSVSILLVLAILASKASARIGIPAVLMFLALGMLAGSEGLGGIYFDNAGLAQSLGVVALLFILFSGGLDTDWKSVRPVIGRGLALSTVGVLITAALVGGFAKFVLGYSWLEGLLLGAIVSPTDAAAVFSVLNGRNIGLKGGLKPLLEFESGSNDPMAVFLTMGLTGILVNPYSSVFHLIPVFFWQMIAGAALGYVVGRVMVFAINRIRLEYEGLYPVLTLSMVLLLSGISRWMHANEFLAVYVAGIVMGNREFIHKRSLMRFHDGITWLMQIMMFITLGLLVFPSHIVPVIGTGLLVSIFLMIVARPAAVFLSLALAGMRMREKFFLSWVGLRGAVPIILATFPLLSHAPHSDAFFNVVFFIVLTSSLLQGTTLPAVAGWLDVEEPEGERTVYPLEYVQTDGLRNALEEVAIPADSAAIGKQIVKLGLPRGALIVLINRDREFIVPGGGTILQYGDRLLVLARKQLMPGVRSIVEAAKDPDRQASLPVDEEQA